ncbi:hypothetical protein GYMLUDRAFT_253541 [Collybiopsis luxurians FD-317 M1]|uniref:Unplaced genomic scaffold GYMLUscaffold_243, whole genome shotgun sequence n=1 Tax=Collybiopsis luxurians FD-317 M1 TaxID=944289 RepID=A0A0D0B6W0_9AGAR|nr:hypothetical protein GYMLUDRAFT_253541 [Collybiopsis luxurians FD-317 M1]
MLTRNPAHQLYFENQYASLNCDAAAAPIQAQAPLHFSIPSVSSQACPFFPSIVIGNNSFDNNHAVNALTSYSNPVLDETGAGADLLTISNGDSEVDSVKEVMDSIKKDLGLMHKTDLTQLWTNFPDLPDIPPGHKDTHHNVPLVAPPIGGGGPPYYPSGPGGPRGSNPPSDRGGDRGPPYWGGPPYRGGPPGGGGRGGDPQVILATGEPWMMPTIMGEEVG